MNNPFTQKEILVIVTAVLADVLGVEANEIAEGNAIANDLGADSLDFVEMNATLEKRLNLSLAKKGALEHANKMSGQPDLFYSNKSGLTSDGVALLEGSLSHYTQLKDGMKMYDIFNLSTVQNVANFCHAIFNYLPTVCPECGHAEARLSVTGKAVCSACSAVLRPLHGDEAEALNIKRYLQEKCLTAA